MDTLKKTLLIVLTLTLLVGFLAACSNPEKAIVGSWACQDTSQPHIFLCHLTFNDLGGFNDGDGDRGVYVISGNVLHLDYYDYDRFTVNFRFSNSRLVITTDDGILIELTRQ